MAINLELLNTRLTEAEEAYHRLLCGDKEVSVSVGNFGSTTYNQASISKLEAYISSLKSQIASAQGSGGRRIMRIEF
ncbi:MAG: gpW family head-tail joining protein [Alphaproteobacteria bacterium]